MDLSGAWQGYFAGTNRGTVFLDLRHNGRELTGTGNLNDLDLGVTTFELRGEVATPKISLLLTNLKGGSGNLPSRIEIVCEVLSDRAIFGSWTSDVSSGKVVLSRRPDNPQHLPPALFSRPVVLQACRLDETSFTGLLEICLRGMTATPVFRIMDRDVTHIKQGIQELIASWKAWPADTINEINIFVTENVGTLQTREILLELKRREPNRLTVTASDSVWVDGKIEQIQKYLQRHRAPLNDKYRKYGTWINSFIFLGMLVWLPSVPDVTGRFVFTTITVATLLLLLFFYNRLLPNTEIFVRSQPPNFWRRNRDTLIVSLITAVAGLALAALGRWIDAFWGKGIGS